MKNILYCLLGVLLMTVAWLPISLVPFIFVAWLPLLTVEYQIAKSKVDNSHFQVWNYSMVFFLLWNIGTTWWIANASWSGFVLAVLANAFLMSLVVMLFHQTKKKLGQNLGYFSWILYWLSFEYLHFNWELAWPWLTLGNVFAVCPDWVQWYEYTGTMGGSLWILVINLFLFFNLRKFYLDKITKPFPVKALLRPALFLVLLLGIPAMISFVLKPKIGDLRKKEAKSEVVVVQPNFDPYRPYEDVNFEKDFQKIFNLAQPLLTDNTDYLVLPETSLPTQSFLYLNQFENHESIEKWRSFLKKYPNLSVIIGSQTIQRYNRFKSSPTARKMQDGKSSYDLFNSALQIDGNVVGHQIYHKSKLVPGIERLPYPKMLGWLAGFSRYLGGVISSMGKQETVSVFGKNRGEEKEQIQIAPVICYESIFGEYVAQYVQEGANLLFVLTNDGWWGDTWGYQQHLHYARLRAVETRRSIARAANQGSAAFITPDGQLHQTTSYNQASAIKMTLASANGTTFYVQHGDSISRLAIFLATVLLLYTFLSRFMATKLSV